QHSFGSSRATRDMAATLPQRHPWVRSECAPRGDQAEDRACHHGHRYRECNHIAIQRNIANLLDIGGPYEFPFHALARRPAPTKASPGSPRPATTVVQRSPSEPGAET